MLNIKLLLTSLSLVLLSQAEIGFVKDVLNPQGMRLLEQQECGKYDESHIFFDGAEVALGSRPWMVLIQTESNPQFPCGGTLISDRFVLFAAHCAQIPNIRSVRLGEHNKATNPDCINNGYRSNCLPSFEDVDIESIFVHTNYSMFQNDIALIKLARKIDFKEHISPICLPVNYTLQLALVALENVYITGWEHEWRSRLNPNVLRETKLEYSYADQEECLKAYPFTEHKRISTQNKFCAIQDKFLCYGNSGSPFFSTVKYFGRKRIVQFGIITSSLGWCSKSPSVSTNIVSFMPWITDILAQDLSAFTSQLMFFPQLELNPEGLRLLEQQECGKYDESQIFVDGAEVALGSRPWMVRIQTNTGDYVCGGTLISDQFVLTSAYCASKEEVHSVRLGEHNFPTDPDCILGNRTKCMPPSENIDIGRIITHANYEDYKLKNDLALIKLAQKVDFKEHISPICLPTKPSLQQLQTLENVFLTGWGEDDLYSRTKKSNMLRETKLEYLPAKQEECFKSISSFAGGQISVIHQICAIQDKFLCFGSSGSPFFSPVEYFGKKRLVQFGVAFFGLPSCYKNPVLSTNIVSFMPWITDILAT